MDENEFREFIKAVTREVVEEIKNRGIEEEKKLDFGKLNEDDYLGANITNLDSDIEVAHRKTGYLHSGTGDLYALCEFNIKRLPEPLSSNLIKLLRMMSQYNSAEEGRAITDLNTGISKKYGKYIPYKPLSYGEEEQEGGAF